MNEGDKLLLFHNVSPNKMSGKILFVILQDCEVYRHGDVCTHLSDFRKGLNNSERWMRENAKAAARVASLYRRLADPEGLGLWEYKVRIC